MDKINQLQNYLFMIAAQNGKIIKNLFFILYIILVLILLFSGYKIISAHALDSSLYSLGKKFGELTLLLLGLVVTPGILGRFGIEIKITRIVTVYRRQFGIITFLTALLHFSLVRMFNWLGGILPFSPFPITFEAYGTLALSLMFLLFVTSNDFSKKTLGKLWKVMHRFIYLILWLLVLHVGLQKIGVWTLFIFGAAIVETFSWIIYFIRKKGLATSSETQSTNSK